MANTIVGTLSINHAVDSNGSLTMNVPLHLPPTKTMPEISLAYHSAASEYSPVGLGWVIKGAPRIERVPATLAQDGFRGVVNYDEKDCFALDGQRLVKISGNEYRFEVEQWSKVIAKGPNPANPDSWEHHLPDGTTRLFGDTPNSNIKAHGQTVTRVWAVSEIHDAFSNYTSFTYDNDTTNGFFYLLQISSGGNHNLVLNHQRRVDFTYQARPDQRTRYLGGYKICATKRLVSITSRVQSRLIHVYHLQYDMSPLSAISRLQSLTLSDASGASVRPLKFHWIDGRPSVFDPTKYVTSIHARGKDPVLIPIDVAATGHSDLVIASKYLNQRDEFLDLAVYRADGPGHISNSPAPGSGPTGLPYPTHILQMDVDGDGKIDLVHISKSRVYTITILLSTKNGYQQKISQSFNPESMSGHFHAGDFEGNGHVGLIYVYEVTDAGRKHIKFIQFTSNGSQFTASSSRSGPLNQALDDTSIIVGDFNGNGAQDVFLASKSSGTSHYKVDFIESVQGKLTYRRDNPFGSCSGKILWTRSSTVLPIAADHDSKTSLLFVSNNAQGKLQMQLVRSTGVTLVPDSQPTVTTASYDGNATISRATSTGAVNLLNVCDTPNGPKVDVFLFDSKRFSHISSVQQPQGVSRGSIATWADPRGIGRVDCVMGTIDTTGTVAIKTLPCCSSDSQPVDYICRYENGLGATVTVLYAPLSDSSTYTASDQTRSTTAAMNAMARNAASSQEIASTRSEIIHFPYYVVKQLSVCPRRACPDVREIQQLTYTNARLEFSGRGWLGFETISRKCQPIGVVETASYFQRFPFLGQVSRTETREVSGGKLLQVNEYPWHNVELNDGKNVSIRLLSLRETFYEAGNYSHAVDVSFEYDNYANMTKTSIACSQTGTSLLTIRSTFSNDLQRWVIGNKTSEFVEQSGTVLKKTEYSYVSGTHIPNCTKKWIADSKWSSQVSEFDGTGNQISVKGPKSLQKAFTYDETYSHMTSIKTWTDASHTLREDVTYDLALGKPLKVTDVNGYEILRKYDVLGRLLEVSEGAASVIERRSYHFEDGQFFEKQLTSTGLGNWNRVITYFDGSERIWKTERSRPDDLSKSIYSFSKYDGAGRLIARARDTMDIDSPSFTTYEYDTRSRLVREVSPPIIANGSERSSVTTTYLYAVGKMTETCSDGNASKDQVTTREISYLPNPEPSADNLIKSFVTELLTPLNQPVKTTFDGLGRPTTITDPSYVQLTLAYDGLSRQTKRELKDATGNKVVSQFTVIFDDDNCQTTVRNELTGSTITSKTDSVDRVIKRETADETISFVYDDGGTYTKGNLFKASSSKGFTQQFDYDLRGHITQAQLQIDGHDYLTSSEWTSAGQLLKITNPDGTVVTRTLLPDGHTVSKIVLSDGSVQASTIFSEYDNPFRRPLTCKFGNGIVSKSSIASNGVLTKNTLKSASGTVLLEQNWIIQASGQIGGYKVSKIDESSTTTLRSNIFQYDLDDQLINDTEKKTFPYTYDIKQNTFSFTYDKSGNLSSKNGRIFVNEGWKLTTVNNPDGSVQSSFDYSLDGNLTAEKDGSGSSKRTMKYDIRGRLIEMDRTTFTYDIVDRLIKTVSPTGEVTIYPSQMHESRRIPTSETVCHTTYINHGYRCASLTTVLTSGIKVGETKTHYFHNDHLCSTIAASDVSGKIITQYQYDSFGKASIQGPDVARYKFQNKELFGSIYYFGARFYDPDLGRFLTLDNFPIDLSKLSPSTFNMYSFARNDPVNYIDFNGNVPWWHWAVDIALVGAGIAFLFVPIPGSQILASVLFNAGVAGLVDDILDASGTSSVSDGVWARDMAISGGIGGLLGFGLGAVANKIIPAATAAQTLSKSSIVLRVAGRVAINAAIGGGLGGGIQVGLNLWEGEQWDKDVLRSAVIGAGSGVLFTGIAEFQAYRGLAMSSRGLRPREGGFQLGRSAARAVDETSFSIRAQTEVTAQASANISASAVERLPSVTSAYSRQILRASQISF